MVTRPVLRYPGGKWRLAPWIVSHLPAHDIYVEPYCGAASVLLRKPRAPQGEVINDLNDEVVNLYQVLRDMETATELERLLRLTPYSRTELYRARAKTDHPIEKARRLIVRSFFGRSSCLLYENTGFRASRKSNTFPSVDWTNYHDALGGMVERIRGVTVENLDALECIERYDGKDTLFYVDLPYVHTTRTESRVYGENEMGRTDHEALADVLLSVEGKVVISGYRCDLYDRLYEEWTRVDRTTRADGGAKRTESLWISPGAAAGKWIVGEL